MKLKKVILFFTFLFPTTSAWATPQLKDEDSITNVINAMTIEEKVALVFGTGMNNATKVQGAAGSTFAIPRLGIPQLVFADGPVGLRLGGGPTGGKKQFATAFPVSIAMASTWDPSLIQRVGGGIADEAIYYGVDLMLGPAINIQRNPLNGRNFEYFSEDPYLNAIITVGYINGMQDKGIGATLKHFAANNQETHRQDINEVISERALREIYFPGFEYALEKAKPWAIMSSYPTINGTPASHNAWLLKEVLRNQWKFNGFVMSDWYAVTDSIKALQNGNDLIMPGGKPSEDTTPDLRKVDQNKLVLAALKSKTITQSQIDENIRNLLNVVIKTHAFKHSNIAKIQKLPDQSALAYQVAADSMVLLKNDSKTLPIQKTSIVATFGNDIEKFFIIGAGSAEVNYNPERLVTLTKGLKNTGLKLVQNVDGQKLNEQTKDDIIIHAAQTADIALISIARTSSEGADRYSMAMHDDQTAMIKKVASAFHKKNKKVVVLLNIDSPIEIASWEKNANAILVTWLPGEQAGNAIADILTGKVNPSGKLPLTFPKRLEDSPSFGNYPGTKKTVIYGEGIYVGYRFFDTRHIKPMYPFGYGLSYSKVKYKKNKTKKLIFDIDNQNTITVKITLHNLSNLDTKEVAQLYIHDNASLFDRPYQELKSFNKTSLSPGEEKEISFTLDKRAFSYFNPDKNDWVLEPGHFTLRIGSSSRDIHAEIPLIVKSSTPTFSLNTQWITIQTYEKAATIVAKTIGDAETNAWIKKDITLGEKLNESLKLNPVLKDNETKRKAIMQEILDQINAL